jgi:hypothetical protein
VTDLQILLLVGAGLGLLFTTDNNRGAGIVAASCVLGTVALEIAKWVRW